MEQNVKIIVAGIGLFLLGVGSTYWLMADRGNAATSHTSATPQHQPAMHAALAQLGNETNSNATKTITSDALDSTTENTANIESADTLTHESFLAAAEARREQQLADKAETDRITKLRQTKADSVECKFWRQQQKTSSAAAKIEEKIKTHCLLASDLVSSDSSSAETIEQ